MTGVHAFGDGLDWGTYPESLAMDQPCDPGE